MDNERNPRETLNAAELGLFRQEREKQLTHGNRERSVMSGRLDSFSGRGGDENEGFTESFLDHDDPEPPLAPSDEEHSGAGPEGAELLDNNEAIAGHANGINAVGQVCIAFSVGLIVAMILFAIVRQRAR